MGFGTLLTYIGVGELSKLMDETGLSPAQAEQYATRILNAASKKGTKELQKVRSVLENIPSIAGSQTLKDFINRSKRDVQKQYENVEDKVVTMENAADQAASDIRAIANKSLLSKAGGLIDKGKTSGQQATDIVNEIETSINDFDNNFNNDKENK